MVSVYPLLLFGGGNLTIDLFKSNFVLSLDDGWIRFMVTTKEVSASIILRQCDPRFKDEIIQVERSRHNFNPRVPTDSRKSGKIWLIFPVSEKSQEF